MQHGGFGMMGSGGCGVVMASLSPGGRLGRGMVGSGVQGIYVASVLFDARGCVVPLAVVTAAP